MPNSICIIIVIMHLQSSVLVFGRVSMKTNKVIIALQGKCINEIWRFNPICLGLYLGSYKLERVGVEIMELFPSISIGILLSHNDSLAGPITL